MVDLPECKPKQKSKPPLREEIALVELEVLEDPFLILKMYSVEPRTEEKTKHRNALVYDATERRVFSFWVICYIVH